MGDTIESGVLSLGSDNVRCHKLFHSAWHCLATETPLSIAKKQKLFLDGAAAPGPQDTGQGQLHGERCTAVARPGPSGRSADRGVSSKCRDAEICPAAILAARDLVYRKGGAGASITEEDRGGCSRQEEKGSREKV